MAEPSLPQRIDYPSPTAFTGDQYRYLLRVAQAINAIPGFSFYSGNPLSNVTATAGNLVVNVATSANTARLWVKHVGSGNTGWVSVATV